MAVRENFSRKRAAIYGVVCATKVHPTAEWVYEALKPDYPDLSLRHSKENAECAVIHLYGINTLHFCIQANIHLFPLPYLC